VEPWAAGGDEARERRATFELERTGMLARRMSLLAVFFVVSVGLSAIVHRVLYPERVATILPIFGVQILVSLAAVAMARVERLRTRLVAMTAVVALLLIWLANLYLVRVGSPLEELALTVVAMLAGASVVLPWTWRAQLAVAAGVLLGFAASAPLLTTAMNMFSLGTSVVTLAILTVVATYDLDRYRYEAFEQALVQRGEAEIAAALMRVGETLHAHLRDPCMLEEVNRLATEVLACDWSGTYLWDHGQAAFVLRALCAPPGSDDRHALAAVTFAADDLPLIQRLRSERIVEIQDGAHQDLVAPELIRYFGIASALYTPIMQDNRLSGVLVHGYRERTGPFSRRQHRLALGIAQAMAVAVENARLFQEVQTASALKSEFVATMSHELRTPLNIICGYADLLREGTFSALTGQQLDTVTRISRSAGLLLELVNTTLDMGRLEAGHTPIDRVAVPVESVLEAVGAEVQALASPELSVTWSAAADLVVVTDRDKLKTIVRNLVANAVKFTPAGRVHVEALWDDGLLTVRVEDTGIGIPEDQQAAIFEMFRQVDGSSTRRFGGVGLGLHIARRLTGLLGGQVRIESLVGVGSTFTVSIPCARTMLGERLRA
jgi:signal transduction histidine kinase